MESVYNTWLGSRRRITQMSSINGKRLTSCRASTSRRRWRRTTIHGVVRHQHPNQHSPVTPQRTGVCVQCERETYQRQHTMTWHPICMTDVVTLQRKRRMKGGHCRTPRPRPMDDARGARGAAIASLSREPNRARPAAAEHTVSVSDRIHASAYTHDFAGPWQHGHGSIGAENVGMETSYRTERRRLRWVKVGRDK